MAGAGWGTVASSALAGSTPHEAPSFSLRAFKSSISICRTRTSDSCPVSTLLALCSGSKWRPTYSWCNAGERDSISWNQQTKGVNACHADTDTNQRSTSHLLGKVSVRIKLHHFPKPAIVYL
jgi:hypothetical protein